MRIDHLYKRTEAFNSLLTTYFSRKEPRPFRYVAGLVCGHKIVAEYVISHGEPSDGHPQEELTPDFQLFRGFQHNNNTWTLFWPELLI